MAYTTVDNVKIVLAGVVDSGMTDPQIEYFVDQADNVINSYLGGSYIVPFSPTPVLIANISTDIASYYIMRTLFTRDSQNINNWIKEFWEKSIALLERIKNNDLILKDAELAGDTFKSADKDYTTVFDIDSELDWKPSKQRLEDIKDAREND